jgi:hypothetical protein
MNEKISLESLLSEYKFTEPLPPEVRKGMLKSRKKTIVHILKKHRQYGLMTFLILSLFFFARKTGITLTLMKATVAAWTAAILTTVAVTGAAVYTVHRIIEKNKPPETELHQASEPVTVQTGGKDGTPQAASAPVIIYHVGIIPFDSSGVDTSVARTITAALKAELSSRLPGKKIAVFPSNDTEDHIIKNMLMGSVIRFGEGYRFTARIIDPVSSKILFYKSVEIHSENDIPEACRNFSGEIAEKLR